MGEYIVEVMQPEVLEEEKPSREVLIGKKIERKGEEWVLKDVMMTIYIM